MSALAESPARTVATGLLCVALATAPAGCVTAGAAPEAGTASPTGAGEMIEEGEGGSPLTRGGLVARNAGLGTLRQDDITLTLQSDELLIKVTPMSEEIIRLTAPDTYERLRHLAASHRSRAENRAGPGEPELFLVSVFSYAPNAFFEPEDLTLTSHGRRFRPAAIQPVTPGWGAQRLEQRQTRIAVYVFEGAIDLETDLRVEYRMARDDAWTRILPVINAERAKVRARGGDEP